MEKIRKYLPSLLIGLLLAAGITFAWNAVWNGTNWIQSGYVVTSKEIGENFEFLYRHSVPDGFPVCQGADKALQWNGSQIVCGTITGAASAGTCGSTSSLLTGGSSYTVADCQAAGGSTYDTTGVGDCICQFAASSCPSGWTKYNNWTETQSRTCTGGDAQCGGSCTTSGHVFADQAVESCTFSSGYYTGEPWPNDCTSGSGTCYAIVAGIGCI